MAFDLNVILTIMLGFGELAGIAAAIAALVNVAKYFGWIPDGYAGSVFAGLDLLAMAVLIGLHFFAPNLSIEWLDAQAGVLAQILLIILGYVMSLKVGSGTAVTLSVMEIPVIGASHTEGTLRADKV